MWLIVIRFVKRFLKCVEREIECDRKLSFEPEKSSFNRTTYRRRFETENEREINWRNKKAAGKIFESESESVSSSSTGNRMKSQINWRMTTLPLFS